MTAMHFTRLAILSLSLAALLPAARSAPLLFDMGPADSAVWNGFTRVTPASSWNNGGPGFGWRTSEGLAAKARAWHEPVENAHRGTVDPPPIWTHPITEDAIIGSAGNTFLIKAAPGDYEVRLVCGTSEPAYRSQFFDFTVQVGGQPQRVQIEGAYQFRTLHFRTRVGEEPLAITFKPRSKWLVNSIIAWTAADAARVRKDIIQPFEEWTFRLPPQEWEKWREEPEPPTGPMPRITEADTQRGFVIYSRHYLECIYPQTRPRPEELNPELRLFAAPGQFATTNLVVLPLKELAGAKVTASSIGPVPVPNIELRRVRFMRARPNYTTLHRYRVVPDVLERFETLEAAAGENARIWVTMRIPDDAATGDYTGSITVTGPAGEAAVPIRLRILPIKLREDPAKIFGIYYRHPYDQIANAPDEVSKEYFRRKADLEHADMAAHGTRNIVLHAGGRPADAAGDYHINWDLLAAKLALWEKHGFIGPIVMSIPTEGIYEKFMKERPGSHLRGVKDPPDAFLHELNALVKVIEAERRRRGWPEFLFYPIDEPSTDTAAVSFMAKVLQACKAAGVRTYVTADPTREAYAPMRPHVDVWCTQPFSPDRDAVLADSRARGVEYWCYPNHVNGENDHTPVAGARMTYGFGFWRSGFRALIPWIYQSSTGDPFNYLDGATMDFFNRSEPDGTPMPVAMWEAYREGYNDYRYLHTLEVLIAEAKKRPHSHTQQAAAHAKQELQFVWNAIRVQEKYKHEDLWSPEEFDVYRWIIAEQILKVQDALKR